MRIISWNVNGINACIKKGLLKFIEDSKADIYLFQEIKADKKTINKEIFNIGYNVFLFPAEKKGYSGVACLTKEKPNEVIKGIGKEKFDEEGRVLTLKFKGFSIVNTYFPHSQRGLKRLKFKLEFNKEFEGFIKKIKNPVIGGDFNVAHQEIDIARPKQNINNAGFTYEEREWFSNFLKKGYIDTFRYFHPNEIKYTWWTYRFHAREKNIGWRIDYFIVRKNFINKVIDSKILSNVHGSDHCPIEMLINH